MEVLRGSPLSLFNSFQTGHLYLEVDEELDEGRAGAVEHALGRTATLQATLARGSGLDLGPGRWAGHDALDRAAHLPNAVGIPGAGMN